MSVKWLSDRVILVIFKEADLKYEFDYHVERLMRKKMFTRREAELIVRKVIEEKM